MNESRISSPQELDATLAANAVQRREKLWKEAEGRSFRWTDLIVALIGGLLTVVGLFATVVEQQIGGAFQLVFGVILLGFSMLRHQQCRIDALREIVREMSGRS